jgi:hypothetical protein
MGYMSTTGENVRIDKDELDRILAKSDREKAERELDLAKLIGVVKGLTDLLGNDGEADIVWALQDISDKSLDKLASCLSEIDKTVDSITRKYFLQDGD